MADLIHRTDRKIIANPWEGTRLPAKESKQVIPLLTEQVEMLRDLMPGELKALVTFTAGTGMRQGEVFGLTLDRIDFLRREVRVDRQLHTRPGRGVTGFGPTKTPASNRTIPLPQVVVDALAVHLRDFPAGESGLVFTLHGAPSRATPSAISGGRSPGRSASKPEPECTPSGTTTRPC